MKAFLVVLVCKLKFMLGNQLALGNRFEAIELTFNWITLPRHWRFSKYLKRLKILSINIINCFYRIIYSFYCMIDQKLNQTKYKNWNIKFVLIFYLSFSKVIRVGCNWLLPFAISIKATGKLFNWKPLLMERMHWMKYNSYMLSFKIVI